MQKNEHNFKVNWSARCTQGVEREKGSGTTMHFGCDRAELGFLALPAGS